MKNISLLVWLSQLGLSVAVPLGGFVLLGVWFHNTFGWGNWVIVLCTVFGMLCSVVGFKNALNEMNRIAGKETKDKPPVSFNDHD